jgi:hypothetical protein
MAKSKYDNDLLLYPVAKHVIKDLSFIGNSGLCSLYKISTSLIKLIKFYKLTVS